MTALINRRNGRGEERREDGEVKGKKGNIWVKTSRRGKKKGEKWVGKEMSEGVSQI